MARVYTSRQLLDPRYIDIMNRNVKERLDTTSQSNIEKANALSNIINLTTTTMGKLYDQKKREDLVPFTGDPVHDAAAKRYHETGDNSGLLQYRQMEEMQKNRDYQAKQKLESDTMEAEPKFIALKNQYAEQLEQGDFTGANETKSAMNVMLRKYPGLKEQINFEEIEQTQEQRRQKRIADEAKAAEEKIEAESKAQEKLDISNEKYNDYMEKMPISYFSKVEDRNSLAQEIRKDEDLLPEHKKELLSKVYGMSSSQEKYAQTGLDVSAALAGEEQRRKREEQQKQKEADDAIKNNTKPSDLTKEIKATLRKKGWEWDSKSQSWQKFK